MLNTQLKTSVLLLAGVMTLGLQGCLDTSSNDDSDEGTPSTANYAPLDATSGAPAYLDLSNGQTVGNTDGWHLAYQKYVGFTINGGSSGDGEVQACIAHQYEDLYDENGDAVKAEFEVLTLESTLADFDAVTKTSCSDFSTDGVESQFKDWYTYNSETHQVTVNNDDSNGWILRSADGNSYARIKATDYGSGGITFDYELWNGSAFNAAVSTGTLDFSSGAVYWDMETNANNSTEMSGWDLKIVKDGYGHKILVNGGASGDGDAGVGSALMVANVDEVTNPTSTSQVYKYFGDSASGPMSSPGSFGAFEYGVGGDNHNMWPTFAVYLFKDGENYYKAQVVSNYGEDGSAATGNLYIRYDEVTE